MLDAALKKNLAQKTASNQIQWYACVGEYCCCVNMEHWENAGCKGPCYAGKDFQDR